ncbi:hypothetical protein C3L29_032935, partial [Pseudomonas sp. MWU12-2534b]
MHRQKLTPLALALAAASALNAPAAFADDEEPPIAVPAPPKEPGRTGVHSDDPDGEKTVILHAKVNGG